MSSLFRRCRSARWPFWLLLAAWFCANSPQAATYGLIVWLGQARHFSHQQRLTLQVATVLGGEHARSALAADKATPDRPVSPPIPAEATLKKIDLAITLSSELIPPACRALVPRFCTVSMPAAPWSEPPSEPPRFAG
jgi:hypothetical protein